MLPYPATAGLSEGPYGVSSEGSLARGIDGVAARRLPPYVVIDARDRIVQFSGGPVAEYLEPASGNASLNVFDLVRASLHSALRRVMEEAGWTGRDPARQNGGQEIHEKKLRGSGSLDEEESVPSEGELLISAERLTFVDEADDDRSAPWLMIMFHRREPMRSRAVAGPVHEIDARSEVDRDRLLTEELRSTRRKLASSREEMQVMQSEMLAVNAELSNKNQALFALNDDFRSLLESTQIATLFLGADLRVRNFTPNVAQLFALRRGDIGRPVTDLRARIDYAEMRDDVVRVVRSNEILEREVGSVQDSGRIFLMRMLPLRRSDGGTDGVVVTFFDITERKLVENRALFLAHHDELTGLANRTVFNAMLARETGSPAGGGGFTSLLYLDLDRFKAVNDAFGHRVGDELLRMVAERLRRCVRAGDVVCRLGGDEFAIIQQIREQAVATALAGRIIAAVGAPYEVDGITVTIGVSVGIALGSDATCIELLPRSADLALYAAKDTGRGNYQVFDSAMQRRIEERRDLERDLGGALARDEFAILFQPLVRLADRRITGAEALIRWHHPRLGVLAPASFIPIAEETGLIVAIGSWVMLSACKRAAAWPRPMQLSVNLSSVQFASPGLLDTVQDTLAKSGLPAHCLTLELTESVLLHDEARTQDRLHALRRLGVQIALDDFGTGYSSLSYLHSFPVDKIKIDRTFTQTLDSRKESSLIVKAVVEIAKGLDIAVCAEGAETDAQLDALADLGVQEAQGFRLFKPMTPSKFANAVHVAG